MLRPIEVRESGVALRLDLTGAGEELVVTGRTNAVSFRCGLAPRNELTAPARAAIHWRDCDAYRRGLLFHGPRFQVLHEVGLDFDDNLYARIRCEKLPVLTGVRAWDALTLLLDGAFQLLALDAIRRFSVEVLPVGVQRVSIGKPATWPHMVTFSVSDRRLENGFIWGDVTAHDDRGSPLLRLEGVRMTLIRPAARSWSE